MRKQLPVLIIILMLSTLLSACAGVAAAQPLAPALQTDSEDTSPPRTISVSGSGLAYLTPDIAYINIGVHTENKDAAEAVSDNNIRSNEVSDALQALGIDEKDIQTTNFSIYPQPEYDSDGIATGKITYIVDNTVFVTVRELDVLGDLLNAAVSAGANSINGIQFDVEDKTAALSIARKSAVENAQVIAEELAETSGVTLGEILSITTYSSGSPTPVYLDGRGGGAAVMAESVPVSPGQMSINVQVNVVYKIR
jgi:uncharacterized protein YggE